ncbi:MAG: hypothetical protein ACRYFS_14875 [Janthinobacterium lividum]
MMPLIAEPKPEPKNVDKKSLPTLWNVPDPLWELIDKGLSVYDPPAKTGRKRSDERLAFDGIIYRAFVRWEQKAIFDILWAILLTKCDDLHGVDWQWQFIH